jgi:biopolymer transport protein ExbB/biopolymer transport protein TolQ
MAWSLVLMCSCLAEDGEGRGWTVWEMIIRMGPTAQVVLAVMFAMSAWSLGVMLDRWLLFTAARKQSRQFAPAVAGTLRAGNIPDAIHVAEYYRKSHLAKVVVAGLQEFRAHQESTRIPGKQIEASRRALERAQAIVQAELERGLNGLATIGSTAPFVGLFGTVVGIVNAFAEIEAKQTTGLSAVAGGISEALITTAIGLFVALPAVWMYNYFAGRVKSFGIEMDNSASELIDYFLKRAELEGEAAGRA